MLMHINPARQKPTVIDGVAHVVIALLPDGRLQLQAFRGSVFDSIYLNHTDAGVLASIPALLAELRSAVAQPSAEGS